ncbi:uncharacterized protein EKO05_0007130 [Ascochyta rabiei]|uniref:uncharacterized protein n=1 Tax=Didymella rabiei TaxID=5454 RepID=UPI002207ADCB|nr:uncharacterized protein EKO05_0007130 [Ascochyta rabiei]UPX16743.1 hypothetical protein EKO05_0007130 [Ascochyta rabiei]
MGLEAVANRLGNTALEAAAEILLDCLLPDHLRNVLYSIAHLIRLQSIAVGKLVLACIRMFLRPALLAARLLRLEHLLQPLHLLLLARRQLPLLLAQVPARLQLGVELGPLCLVLVAHGCFYLCSSAVHPQLAPAARLFSWLAALSGVVSVHLAVYDDSHAAVTLNELAHTLLCVFGLAASVSLALRAVRGASDKNDLAGKPAAACTSSHLHHVAHFLRVPRPSEQDCPDGLSVDP